MAPQVLWPGIVLGLLLLSVGAQVFLVIVANSDGGAQVERDYYQRAVDWDQNQLEQARSKKTGWKADIRVEGTRVSLILVDAHDQGVEGVAGQIQLYRPSLSKRVGAAVIHPGDRPGTYTCELPLRASGFWDFVIRVHRGDDVFVTTLRRELSPPGVPKDI